MNCPKCGTTIADGAVFCGHCGANLAAESGATGSTEAKPAEPPPAAPGAAPTQSDTITRLIARVKAILLTPATEWAVIEREATTAADIYTGYVAPLAAIGAIASFIGLSLIGFGLFRVGIIGGFMHAVLMYLFAFLVVFVVAWLVDALAPTFGGQRDSLRALKVTAYSYTPAWIAGVLNVVPTLGVLVLIASLYGLYLFYLGLPVLMRCPKEKALGYTGVIVLCAIVIGAILGILSSCFIGGVAMMGAARM